MFILMHLGTAHRQHILIMNVVKLRCSFVVTVPSTLSLTACDRMGQEGQDSVRPKIMPSKKHLVWQTQTFGQSLTVLFFGVVGITAQLTICSLQLLQLTFGYLAKTKTVGQTDN